jgi:hypothetical protein
MNSKVDKIALLKAIAAGQIRPAEIPKEPIIFSQAEEMFIGLMMTEAPVVFVGEARKNLDELLQSADIDQKAI